MKPYTLASILSGVLILTACGGSSGGGTTEPGPEEPSPPSPTYDPPSVDPDSIEYNDVPVHDPSVIRDEDGTFYVVGSHLAMARSTDLVTWEQVAPGIDLESPDLSGYPLFGNYETEVAEGIEWTGGYVGSWASDITQLADGRYYFYYNHCSRPDTGLCNGPRSYLGVAVADELVGPYENVELFLRSGQTREETQQGYGVGDIEEHIGHLHPNTIDPHTFYDKDGELWMIYGSYFGGIHILKMDESTGLPLPDQNYGTHLIGGDHAAIEGPYMLYSPESDYYYMFVSYGGYEQQDGYNLRIARSRNPDGPFYDAEGNDVASARGNWDSIAPYGVKMIGGFEFNAYPGDPADSRGYMAPGHNSAYYDQDTGQHFLILHTRFPNRGQEHAIRVHEMFVSADGWLLSSPHRYAPLEGENRVDSEKIVGDYQYIDHGKDINREPKQSLSLVLTEDGRVTGDKSGGYRLYDDEPNRITLEMDGVTYEGVTRWQWDERIEALVPVFTALSPEGATVWGSQLPSMDNAEVLQAIADELQLPDTFKGNRIELPSKGTRGAMIVWETDNEQVIKSNGDVTRPNVGHGDQVVTLTATISRQDQEQIESFTVLVPQRQTFNRLAQFDFDGDLSETLGNFSAAQATGDRIWKLGEANIEYQSGMAGDALYLDGSNGVLLPEGLITNYEYTVSLWVNPTSVTAFSPSFFAAVNEQEADDGTFFSDNWISVLPEGWDGNTMVWSGSDAWFDGTAGEAIPEGEWSHLAFSVENGFVRVYIDGEQTFSGGTIADFFTGAEGRFALGVNYWDLPFHGLIDELRVYEAALSGGEIRALDIDRLPSDELLDSARDILELGNISAVQENLRLPVTGPFAAAISWMSSDPSVIEIDGDTGIVTRPGADSSDVDVTLTATITLDGQSTTKAFTATVMSLAPPEPVAVFTFDEHLGDEMGNVDQGSVSGNRIDNSGGNLIYEEGRFGHALRLDGDSGIRLPDNLITNDVYSFGLWLNPTGLSQFTTAFFGAASQDSWISVVPNGPGDGNTQLWSGTAWFDGDTGTQISTGTWTHFAAVNNGGSLTLYLDGEAVFSADNFPDVFSPASNAVFALGVNYWDTPFEGLVDELVIYDQPLTAEEVDILMQSVTD